MLKVVSPSSVSNQVFLSHLDEIARQGTRRMLVEAQVAEVSDYVGRHRAEVGDDGHRLVVRNGLGGSRSVTLEAGTVEGKSSFRPVKLEFV